MHDNNYDHSELSKLRLPLLLVTLDLMSQSELSLLVSLQNIIGFWQVFVFLYS